VDQDRGRLHAPQLRLVATALAIAGKEQQPWQRPRQHPDCPSRPSRPDPRAYSARGMNWLEDRRNSLVDNLIWIGLVALVVAVGGWPRSV